MLPKNFRMAPISALLAVGAAAQYVGQGGDGNPHNWDRRRRCDHSQYSPTCGPCEGYGGIPYGDENDERVPAAPAAFPPPPRARRPAPRRRITLTSCEVVANKSDVDPATLAAPVWGRSWVSGTYFEVLIGPKLDPFCFSVIPSNSSEGGLCYRADYGSQWYDMTVDGPHALKYDLNSQTSVGNITSTVLHQQTNFWITNHFPWYASGLHQCVCTKVREGGATSDNFYYPIQYNWTDNLFYVGRERVGVEYTGTTQVLDHWAFGPHHVWTRPENGSMIRMWQPYNGLQIFPAGTDPAETPPGAFDDIPPQLCKGGWPTSGGAAFRVHCDDDGYYSNASASLAASRGVEAAFRAALADRNATALSDAELGRAAGMPGAAYRGADFGAMSATLNGHLARAEAATC